MPRLMVSIQDFTGHICVLFIDRATRRQIGPMLRFSSEEMLFELLRRTHANLETINIVEMSLRQRRPCIVDVDLTDEQYRKLRRVNVKKK